MKLSYFFFVSFSPYILIKFCYSKAIKFKKIFSFDAHVQLLSEISIMLHQIYKVVSIVRIGNEYICKNKNKIIKNEETYKLIFVTYLNIINF